MTLKPTLPQIIVDMFAKKPRRLRGSKNQPD
jgi:hypothetical protein